MGFSEMLFLYSQLSDTKVDNSIDKCNSKGNEEGNESQNNEIMIIFLQ